MYPANIYYFQNIFLKKLVCDFSQHSNSNFTLQHLSEEKKSQSTHLKVIKVEKHGLGEKTYQRSN